jgi:hypothetical protein
MEETRNAYKIVFGNPEGMKTLGRLRCRWDDNIRKDLREIVWEVVDWSHLTQHRVQCWLLLIR